jgi:superfamily II DNA/RNA helicase
VRFDGNTASCITTLLQVNRVYSISHTSYLQNYVHRSGRTARAQKEGLSVMIVSPEDVKNYRKIIKTLNRGQYVTYGELITLFALFYSNIKMFY